MKAPFALFILVLLFGCSKKDAVVPVEDPIPVVATDTLTSGWTKANGVFLDIYFLDPLIGYAVNENGMFKSNDGGLGWSQVYSANSPFFNVSGTTDGKIYSVGGTTSMIATRNSGASIDITNFNDELTDVYFPFNNKGYAVGKHNFFQTSNGGLSWSQVLPVSGLTLGLSYQSLFFVDSTTGWVVSERNIFRTNGSVNNWSAAAFNQSPSYNFNGIYAIGTSIVYACTENGEVYKSTNGGVNFTLMIALPTPASFCDIHFVDANTGYVSNSNKIFKTTNGGVSWQTVVSLAIEQFVELHFTDANHGWACAVSQSANGALLIFRQ